MTKWIADYEVVSHLSLAEGESKLTYNNPIDSYEVHIKNLYIKPPVEKPLISVQVILETDVIDNVADLSRKYLKLFLNILTLVTNSKFTIHRLLRVIDWSPGLEMRNCHQFFSSPDFNIPLPLLNNKILDSVYTLMKSDITNDLRRALRWFSRGVGANYIDEQFQYFWFALETIAEKDKDKTKVPDQCPKCQSPLYCETCKETPMHRPYPKQAIEQLIKKVVKGNPEKLFETLSKVRNELLHGEDSDEIEKSLPTDMSQLVDVLGQTVWAALINSFQAPAEGTKLNLLRTNRFSHRRLVTTLVGSVGSASCKDDPQIEKVPLIKMEMHVSDEQELNKS